MLAQGRKTVIISQLVMHGFRPCQDHSVLHLSGLRLIQQEKSSASTALDFASGAGA